jgi:hypothetical protein
MSKKKTTGDYFEPIPEVTPMVEFDETAEYNSAPLELTEELEEELLGIEREKDKIRESIRSHTEHYLNGLNEWKLIAKTYNNTLDYEHTTMAMFVGKGVLMCLKEAVGQKMSTTMCYVPGVRILSMEDGKYCIR